MCERLKQTVLKTVIPERVSGVRIPLPPPETPRTIIFQTQIVLPSEHRQFKERIRLTGNFSINRARFTSALGGVIHPYPTQAEIIKRLGDASQRGRLKPWMKRVLIKIFQWRR
jgi:hypothetical protein